MVLCKVLVHIEHKHTEPVPPQQSLMHCSCATALLLPVEESIVGFCGEQSPPAGGHLEAAGEVATWTQQRTANTSITREQEMMVMADSERSTTISLLLDHCFWTRLLSLEYCKVCNGKQWDENRLDHSLVAPSELIYYCTLLGDLWGSLQLNLLSHTRSGRRLWMIAHKASPSRKQARRSCTLVTGTSHSSQHVFTHTALLEASLPCQPRAVWERPLRLLIPPYYCSTQWWWGSNSDCPEAVGVCEWRRPVVKLLVEHLTLVHWWTTNTTLLTQHKRTIMFTQFMTVTVQQVHLEWS